MLENSQDLLNIIKAASLSLLVVFACWAIYYFAMILRQVFKIIKEARESFHKVSEVIEKFKEKIEHSASYLLLIGEGVKKIVEVLQDKNEKESKRKKKK